MPRSWSHTAHLLYCTVGLPVGKTLLSETFRKQLKNLPSFFIIYGMAIGAVQYVVDLIPLLLVAIIDLSLSHSHNVFTDSESFPNCQLLR